MSVRPTAQARVVPKNAPQFLNYDELAVAEARANGVGVSSGFGTDPRQGGVSDAQIAFDELTSVEQSAASLGVHPEAWKPISFMNEAHYKTLMANNALDATLARRIEAFRTIASQDAANQLACN